MPSITYRANLTAAEFPLLSEMQGRTIIMPTVDQNFSRQLNSTRNKDRDVGVPQVYYMHNVIPTEAGLASTAFVNLTYSPYDSDSAFTSIYIIRDSSDNRAYLGITTSGRCYILLSNAGGWIRTTDVAPASGKLVTTAYVNGITYIYFGGVGCYKYNFTTNVLDAVALTALTAANVLGIVAAKGYMIAWTATAIAWCSSIDPTDFTPSIITGAGGGNPQEIKANISICLAQDSGFIAYTKANAVAFVYTGNPQYPFNSSEILSCGGLSSTSMIASDASGTNHYAYTTSGFQAVNASSATIIFPWVTDFLAGSQFEDFDEITGAFTITALSSPMKKKIRLIANRYLIISYGITEYTHALMYDSALERWGKFKTTHVDCYENFILDPNVTEVPRRSIAFVDASGSVKVVAMSYDTVGSSGVVVLGKYQLDRAHYIEMQEIHLENVKIASNFTLGLLTSLDGKNTSMSTPALQSAVGTYRKYVTRKTGVNHSLVLSGGFHATSLELQLVDAGSIR